MRDYFYAYNVYICIMLNCLYCVKRENLKNAIVLFSFFLKRRGVGALDKWERIVYVYIFKYIVGITSWEFVVSIF